MKVPALTNILLQFSYSQHERRNSTDHGFSVKHQTRKKQFMSNIMLSQRGIALLITLWLMIILSVMVFSFSLLVRTESHATLSFKEGNENKFLAEAGIQRGIAEIIYRYVNYNQNITLEGKEVFRTDGTAYTGQLGDGYYVIRITNEAGKLDLNTLSDLSGTILNNLLVNLGVAKETADTIVDSILDWKDADDLVRLNGAESEYYMSLPNPYKAKNVNFDSMEELFLVKGVTYEMLYGSEEKRGLMNFLTVYSKTGKINLNSAPREILRAIPGMTEDTVEIIVTNRQSNTPGRTSNTQSISGNQYGAMASFIGTDESNVFTIDSVGYKKNEKKGYAIRATVIMEGTTKYRYLYYKSPVFLR
jgi:general secretion pathway protein K